MGVVPVREIREGTGVLSVLCDGEFDGDAFFVLDTFEGLDSALDCLGIL